MSEEDADGGRDFSVLTRQMRGMPVVQVSGEVDLATIPDMRREISAALDNGAAGSEGHPAALVLDLTQTRFFDSAGIGLLVEQRRELEDRGTAFGLVVGEGPVLRVLEHTDLERIIPIYPDPVTAAESLSGA